MRIHAERTEYPREYEIIISPVQRHIGKNKTID